MDRPELPALCLPGGGRLSPPGSPPTGPVGVATAGMTGANMGMEGVIGFMRMWEESAVRSWAWLPPGWAGLWEGLWWAGAVNGLKAGFALRSCCSRTISSAGSRIAGCGEDSRSRNLTNISENDCKQSHEKWLVLLQ